MRWFSVCLICLLPFSAAAQERLVRLHAPEALVETGLFDYILPRFTLKTRVKVALVPEPEAEMRLGPEGRALFSGAGATWHVSVMTETEWTGRFVEWLTSDVGRRTILAYAPEGAALFSEPVAATVEAAPVEISGDAGLGLRVAKTKCARCHAVDEATRKTTIGSTPSFFVLRAFEDWENRFGTFYVLNPHPAFTQIADVTDPFPIDRPSPIVPVEMTLAELEAVLAYVAGLAAADLGPPLRHQ